MALKLNISEKGKAWKVEIPNDVLSGKSLGEKFDGETINSDLQGYELEITGGCDFSGFPMSETVEGVGIKKLLLKKGWGMWTKPKGLKKKKQRVRGGLRLRKSVRGKVISEKTVQLNLKVIKAGSKKLTEIFPDQNKPKDAPAPQTAEAAPAAE